MAGQKAKLRGEMILIDNRIQKRQQMLGIDLYDALVVHARSDPLFIIEDESLENIRGDFVTCFKDNKALLQERDHKRQQIIAVGEQREVAYPKAQCNSTTTMAEQIKNGAKAANFVRMEMAAKTKIKVVDDDMIRNKQKFGEQVYKTLCRLEDEEQWLPQDRDIRFLYDQARRDISQLLADKQQKLLELNELKQERVL